MTMPPRTVGDELLETVHKISAAVNDLRQKGMPEAVIVLWICKKTRLSQTVVKQVLDALREISAELSKPART